MNISHKDTKARREYLFTGRQEDKEDERVPEGRLVNNTAALAP